MFASLVFVGSTAHTVDILSLTLTGVTFLLAQNAVVMARVAHVV